jgi:hypothetical protein
MSGGPCLVKDSSGAAPEVGSSFANISLPLDRPWTVPSVDSETEEALVDSARSEGPSGDTGYESDLVASLSSVFITD